MLRQALTPPTRQPLPNHNLRPVASMPWLMSDTMPPLTLVLTMTPPADRLLQRVK